MTPQYNDLQKVKRQFFALRNGVVADTLRRAGSSFRIIFGLNLPQLCDIAAATPHTGELAEQLWHNTSTRESMLLAPMIFPRGDFDMAAAERWLAEPIENEVADILCLKLLRHLPIAAEILEMLNRRTSEAWEYLTLRLALNLLDSYPEEALKIAQEHPRHPLSKQIMEDLDLVNFS